MPFSPVAFPLHPIVDGRCGCGFEGCTRIGKHPAALWRELSYGDPVPRPAPGAGVGLKTGAAPRGSGVFVVDLDGDDAIAAWEEFDGGGASGNPMAVETPRGWHLYFEHPGFAVKTSRGELWHNGKKGAEAQGIDVRGEGGFVVAPGSPHRSGKTYEEAIGELGPAPPWLIDWLHARKPAGEVQLFDGDVEGAERARRVELYRDYLETAPPCVQGQGGDETLFQVVQRGAYDLALPVEDVLSALEEVYDPRCDPPWGEELESRVLHKANDAKTNSTRPAMPPLPADLAHLARASALEMPDFRPPELPEKNSEKPGIVENQLGSLGERWGRWDTPLEPPVYLLDGLIPKGKVCTFFAEGGSVKTWSALALAISVATGRPWLGSYGVRQGKALYLDYEDGPYEVARRVRMLSDGADVPDLGYLYGGANVDDVELWRALAKKVVAEGISLVVVDSLGAGMPGDADENTTAFAAGMKIAGRFTETGCTVVFVHHANKTGGMRGTSAARDQSDVVFRFEPVSETDDVKRMRMVCDKPGPQKRPAPVNVELTDEGLTTFEDEAQATGRNATNIEDVKAAVLLALSNGSKTGAELRVSVGGSKDRVDEAVALLRSRGEIFTRGKIRGWEIDSEAARRERILAAVPDSKGTAADLGRAAYATTDEVDALVRSGVIRERVAGRAMGFVLT